MKLGMKNLIRECFSFIYYYLLKAFDFFFNQIEKLFYL